MGRGTQANSNMASAWDTASVILTSRKCLCQNVRLRVGVGRSYWDLRASGPKALAEGGMEIYGHLFCRIGAIEKLFEVI